MHDLGTGVNGFGRALRFAFRNGMGGLFLLPVVLWVLFAAGLFAFGSWSVAHAGAWADAHLGLDVGPADATGWQGFWGDVKALINGARGLLVLIVLKVALFYLWGLIGKYVVLAVLSPVLAYASERTEQLVTGRTHPFHLGRFLHDLGRGLLLVLRNGTLELLINVAVWVTTLFVPVLAPLSVIFLWLVSCWFYGSSMFDYVFERQRLGIAASIRAARARRGLVVGNGIAFDVLMRIPFIGIVFAPLLAAIGAVLAWYAPAGTSTFTRP